MKFTDRFLKLPVRKFNAEESELMGKDDYECEQVDSFEMILPSKIESYEPAMPAGGGFGADKETCTQVNMQSGKTILAWMNVYEFEEMLNKATE